MLKSPIFYIILAFVLCGIIMDVLLLDFAYMDAWNYPIGKSGAWLHYVGVNLTLEIIGWIIAFLFCLWVWQKFKKNEDKLNDPEDKMIDQENKIINQENKMIDQENKMIDQENKVIDQEEKKSVGILASLNKGACVLWNLFITALVETGIAKAFNKRPITTVILSFFAILLMPSFIWIIFILGIIALINGANKKTKYLVPDEE